MNLKKEGFCSASHISWFPVPIPTPNVTCDLDLWMKSKYGPAKRLATQSIHFHDSEMESHDC